MTGGDSLADVVERMSAVFESRLSRPVIVRVVRRCRRELDIASGPPRTETVEDLARQRLANLVGTAG